MLHQKCRGETGSLVRETVQVSSRLVVSSERQYSPVTDRQSHQRDSTGKLQACSLIRETVQASYRLAVLSERQCRSVTDLQSYQRDSTGQLQTCSTIRERVQVSYKLVVPSERESPGQLQTRSPIRETVQVSYSLVVPSERQYRSVTGWQSHQRDSTGQLLADSLIRQRVQVRYRLVVSSGRLYCSVKDCLIQETEHILRGWESDQSDKVGSLETGSLVRGTVKVSHQSRCRLCRRDSKWSWRRLFGRQMNTNGALTLYFHFRDALFNRTTSMAADLDRKAQQIDGMNHLFNKEILLRSFFCLSICA